ncbi:MAG: uridine diphosphate-N-acetylglucosamine-binding protein YvcK [Candidatus Aenigmarchaeota archaeon]|nr:uridine diphosphate-N-acetylglucosamine-binding protein YvcK [Candidatus Aenigmarchaeota archaeon]
MSIKLIIFDLEDVLVNSWHGVSKRLDIDEQEFRSVDHSDLRKDLQLGKISEEKLFEEFIKRTGTKYSVEQLKSLVREELVPIPGMLEIVKSLRPRYKLAILSNFTKEWADYLIQKYELDKLFDATFWSFERGIKKPWHESYLEVIKHFSIPPENSLLIDDKIRNTEAASKLGFHVITFESLAQCKRELLNLSVNAWPNVVLIGGGTGLPILIKGLRKYDVNITAIVTVMDNGRNSGMLRKDYGILPPGDIRNCLVALSNADETLKNAFDYRFLDGYLEGTSIGNLLLLSFTKLFNSFEEAIKQAGKILKIRGKVFPVTGVNTDICAKYENGIVIQGEAQIRNENKVKSPIAEVFLKPSEGVKALPEAVEEIENADVIVFGPGGLYTSVIPNLLVAGVPEAIKQSMAKKVFICNVMTQPYVTDDFTVSKHVDALEKYLKGHVLNYVIVNTAHPDETVLEHFTKLGASMVQVDKEKLNSIGLIEGNFLNERKEFKWGELGLLTHDSEKLAASLMKLIR